MSKSPANRLGRGLSTLIGRTIAPLGASGIGGAAVVASDTERPNAARSIELALGGNGEPQSAPGALASRQLLELSIDRIQPNPYQPRTSFGEARLTELADSLRRRGVLQPVLVRPLNGDRYELVAGERRWRAAAIAGLRAIPAIVRKSTDAESLEIALLENLQREDLSPLDRASAYKRYLEEFSVTADVLAERLGESRPNVSNYLRLLRLPQEVQDLLRIGELGMGQARAIAALSDPKRQLGLARLAMRRNLSVRQVETLVRSAAELTGPPDQSEHSVAARLPSAASRHAEELASRLSKAIGMTVQIIPGRSKNAGRVVIHYKSLEDFDRLADAIGVDVD